MNKKKLNTATLVMGTIMATAASAQPEFVIPAGASGCMNCHLDDVGTGFKAGVLDAFNSGGLPGLKEFLHPTPIVAGDTKPVLHPINNQWDVTVGAAPLVIPLVVSDEEGDLFSIIASKPTQSLATRGALLSTERTDVESNLPVIDFNWLPTAAQANKTYTVNFTVQEKGIGRKLLSNTVTATINVWPARHSATKNISQFKVQRAQWINNHLNLSGSVVFKNALTTAQRNAVTQKLALKMRTNTGSKVGSMPLLTVDASGNWQKTLFLKASSVPCTIKFEYEGLNATSPVKLAPKKTCLR